MTNAKTMEENNLDETIMAMGTTMKLCGVDILTASKTLNGVTATITVENSETTEEE